MAFTGGYNIVDLTEHGRLSVPGEFTPTAEQMAKITDPLKPTFVVARVHLTVADIDSDIAGFGVKTVNEGTMAYTIHNIAFTKNGNKLALSSVS